MKRALIIDDDPGVLKLLHAICESAGYRVETTNSAGEFRRLALKKPDFLLMDLMMSGVDGVEQLRFLAENHVTAAIILISGADPRIIQSAAHLATSQGLRIHGTIGKPFDPAELSEILGRKIVRGPRSSNAATLMIEPADIEEGMRNGALLPFFQPQVDLRTNRVVGCEALARWNHPERGLIYPDQFIAVAEHSGLIAELTECMVIETLKQCALFAREGFPLRWSINVSAISLADIRFPDRFVELLEFGNIAPQSVIIEITESRLLEDSVKSIDVLTRLRVKGVELSIDDFGTGYSSLKQLQHIPFNELKIDKEFVIHCMANSESESIVRTSIELAQRLKIRTVAEGVESLKIAERLCEWGCELGQGYVYAKALAADAFLRWVQKRKQPMQADAV